METFLSEKLFVYCQLLRKTIRTYIFCWSISNTVFMPLVLFQWHIGMTFGPFFSWLGFYAICSISLSLVLYYSFFISCFVLVPDLGSRDRDVVLVRPTISSWKPRGVGNLERGGNGEGMGRGRSVYEYPGVKVDRFASRQRRDSK